MSLKPVKYQKKLSLNDPITFLQESLESTKLSFYAEKQQKFEKITQLQKLEAEKYETNKYCA